VGVVDEAVEDCVGDGRVGDRLVPVIDRQLAGHDGGAAIVPIVDNLQQIATLLLRQRGEPPVVEDQKLACFPPPRRRRRALWPDSCDAGGPSPTDP
jgi:hypothetical protein